MLYKIALFLHVTGALMICAALAMEWLYIISIKHADNMERIRESVFNYSKMIKIGDMGVLLILIPGVYMMVSVWGVAMWIVIGFIGLLLIGIIGGALTGKTMKNIKKMMENQNNNSKELEKLLKNNPLWFSIKIRTAIFLGVIFLMTVKPGLPGSFIVIVVSIILGSAPFKIRYILPATAERNTTLNHTNH